MNGDIRNYTKKKKKKKELERSAVVSYSDASCKSDQHHHRSTVSAPS